MKLFVKNLTKLLNKRAPKIAPTSYASDSEVKKAAKKIFSQYNKTFKILSRQ